MSCNCNGCGQPERLCRCPKGKGEAPKRAYIAECTDCDPCRPCKSMVKICSFVTPTLTEGQRFRNSFVYNQEDDSVYYISDDGTPTRFGSSPMFIDNFNPDDKQIPRQTVFDFTNQKAYIYDPEGNYITVDLAGGEEAPLKLTVQVDPEDVSSLWYGDTGKVGLLDYSTAVMGLNAIFNANFYDPASTANYTAEDVFNMLSAGRKIIFDNVPFSLFAANHLVYPEAVSGLEVLSHQTLSNEATDETFEAFAGETSISVADEAEYITLPHSWGIAKRVYSASTDSPIVEYSIYVDSIGSMERPA